MKKHFFQDLILKTEIEVLHLSLNDPLMMRGRQFLQKAPFHKVDALLEKNSDQGLFNLLAFFGFLLKRDDLSCWEKDKIRMFAKTIHLEQGKRERKILAKKVEEQRLIIERQKSITKGIYQIFKATRNQLNKEIQFQREMIQGLNRSVKHCKLIILLLSVFHCIESTAQVISSTLKGGALKVKALGKTIIATVLALWTGRSMCKKRK